MNPQIFTFQTSQIELFSIISSSILWNEAKISAATGAAEDPLPWCDFRREIRRRLLAGFRPQHTLASHQSRRHCRRLKSLMRSKFVHDLTGIIAQKIVAQKPVTLSNIRFGGCVFVQINFGAKSSVTFSSDVFSRLYFVRLRFRSVRFVWLPLYLPWVHELVVVTGVIATCYANTTVASVSSHLTNKW